MEQRGLNILYIESVSRNVKIVNGFKNQILPISKKNGDQQTHILDT